MDFQFLDLESGLIIIMLDHLMRVIYKEEPFWSRGAPGVMSGPARDNRRGGGTCLDLPTSDNFLCSRVLQSASVCSSELRSSDCRLGGRASNSENLCQS